MNHEIPISIKREAVRQFYKDSGIDLKENLGDKDIMMLWSKMNQLKSEISHHFHHKPGAKKSFLKKLGLVSEEKSPTHD